MEDNVKLECENERMGGVPTTVEPRQIVNESAVRTLGPVRQGT